jgi:acyl-CoA thioester hydrolase
VLFDRAVDEVYETLGIGPSYLERAHHSTMTAEVHVRYLREIHEGAPVQVRFQLIDYDAKRMHYFEELVHATDGWLSATSENMTLHIDMKARKVAPWPPAVMERLAHIKAVHGRLPLPEGIGRRIAMKRA